MDEFPPLFDRLLSRVRATCPWFEDEWTRYSSSSEFVAQYQLDHLAHFARFLARLAARNEWNLVREGTDLLQALPDEPVVGEFEFVEGPAGTMAVQPLSADFVFGIVIGPLFEALQEEAAEVEIPSSSFETFLLTDRYLEWWRAMAQHVQRRGK